MKKIHTKQLGMTLLELLIAITIGLFIIGAALMVFQNVSGIGGQISELTQLRQQGLHAFRVLGKQVGESGSVEPDYMSANANFKFDEPYVWVGGSSISNWTPPSGTDYLSISQQEQKSSVYKDILLNCLGQKVDANSRSSNFYLQPVPGESFSNLMCVTGVADTPQPVISNVASFKVRYRVRSSASNFDKKFFVDTPTNWALVDAVEVCLDLVGKKITPVDTLDGGGNALDSQYQDCQGNQVTRGHRLHVVQRNLFTVHSAQR